MKPRAVVLISGGLDSAVTLFIAKQKGYWTHALTFYYHQRNDKEIACARKVAKRAGSQIKIVKLNLPWKGSSLIDRSLKLPLGRSSEVISKGGIPSTYVPARNTIFLSLAAGYAEYIGARTIFIGAHSDDSSGYPDCRKAYIRAFDKAIRLGTKLGAEGLLRVEAPLIDKRKKDIIKLGSSLGVPYQFTWSCYQDTVKPCGRCDSCVLRAKGFREAGIKDPLRR